MTHKYIFLETLGSSLMKCQHKDSERIVAIKTYRYADHPVAKQLIRTLKKCKDNKYTMDYIDVFKRKKRICIVLEYIPRRLLSLIKNYPNGLPEDYVKLLMFQLFTAMQGLHMHSIVHRDIKPEKILLQQGDVHVKLGGFGLARKVEGQMTPHITTSWYRAPEIICEESGYGTPIDVWAGGLVMAELLDGKPLLPGSDEIEILSLIQSIIGPLSEKQKRFLHKKKIQVPPASLIGKGRYNTQPLEKRYRDKVSKAGLQFLRSVLKCNPSERPSAEKCLQNIWFEGMIVEKLMNKYSHERALSEESQYTSSSSNVVPSNHLVPSTPIKSMQPSQTYTSKTKRRFPVRINGNYKIQIGSNSNHLAVVLHRIPRVKASDKKTHNIPSLGTLKVHRVDDYLDTVPPEWKHLGGVFVPLYQSEALKISFENCISTEDNYSGESTHPPKAVKLAYGSLNAKSGQAWKRESKALFDHFLVYSHKREFVEGVINNNDDLHQFCSSSLENDVLNHDTSTETMQIVMYETKLVQMQQQSTTSALDHAKGIQINDFGENPSDLKSALLPNIKGELVNQEKLKRRKGLAKYEIIETVGEGTYGVVMKARDRETMQIVAIKKFKDSEYDDEAVKKTTQREKKILQQLTQDNIVQLKENFKRKGKMYLVFEYVPKNMLEALEEHEHGFEPELIRVYMYQILKALEYCHEADIIHRDVKLENLLLHSDHTLKLCDFGFARTLSTNGTQTPYVSTRWYRAPELLVNAEYGKPVDIWAVGCIMGEIVDGKPLFPGTTDLDQLYLIQNIEGEVPSEHIEAFYRKYRNYKFPKRTGKALNIQERYGSKLDDSAIDFMRCLLKLNPQERWTATQLLKHPYFDGLDIDSFLQLQREKLESEAKEVKVTGDPRELPKLLTNWNQGGGLTPETFQENLSMKPPIAPSRHQNTNTSSKIYEVSPSQSPLKKEVTQPHIITSSTSTAAKQRTPRRNEKVQKQSKHEVLPTSKLVNRRRSSLPSYDDVTSTISISKPQSRSSSRQSSRQSSRLGICNNRQKNVKDHRPPLPIPTSNDRLRNNTIQANPSKPVIDFTKFGRFYLHIVNSEQYKMITGFSPDHEPIEKTVYEELGIPWFEEYHEFSLPLHDSLSHIGFIQPKKSEMRSTRDRY